LTILALALSLVVGHEVDQPKEVALRVAGMVPLVAVRYDVAPRSRARALRELADRDGDERVSGAESEALEARLVEEATYALTIAINGLRVPFEVLEGRAFGATGPVSSRDRLAVALLLEGQVGLWCGWHHVAVSDRTPGQHPIMVRWPDGQTSHLVPDRPAARLMWLCGAGAAGPERGHERGGPF